MSSIDSRSTTLVIGAGGRHGGTGSHVAQRLQEQNHTVRVLVRTEDERAQRLRALGAQIAVGDLLDRRTLDAAVDGVDTVYFTYPVAPGVVQAATNLASAMRAAASTPRLVVMSMAATAADSPSGLGRAHWAAEEVFSWAGLEPAVLRIAALFYENIPLLHAESIRRTGGFANSFGAAAMPWISGHDAADLAVAALIDPDRYPAATTSYPPGAAVHTHAEIAALIAAEIGSPVGYQQIPAAQWQRDLEDLARRDTLATINPEMAQHISSLGAKFSQNPVAPRLDSTALGEAIGHPPQTFADFIHNHRDRFIEAPTD
ncbi:NmrA family NAD(P)-binding protein [Nocardia terrae]|uniref:NmrA family NAD(P)-binding protein n=1 Tax=Nocardia terrae TaxID=2675851 RepID=UPI0012F868F7|nr:NmrA family NAD(P)-binding protein [Nocardia terrae]